MTDEQIALARRLVACEQWEWVPGMQWDLSDYATAAILLRMACEGYEMGCTVSVERDRVFLGVELSFGEATTLIEGPDLGTAAAKALLAIWEAGKDEA